MGRRIKYIGSAIGNCGRAVGCEKTPALVLEKLHRHFAGLDSVINEYHGAKGDLNALQTYFTGISTKIAEAFKQSQTFPLLIGGDHACAIGSWSGIAASLAQNNSELGLIWVDAHMDAHRPDTSESGNLHGMPVAHLLGYGHDKLTTIGYDGAKLKPENLVYFAVRSFEPAEEELLQKLGVKIYYRHLLTSENFTQLFTQEFERLSKKTNGNVGISLDLDALDPEQIMAVSVPEEDGISPSLFLDTFKQLDINKLVAFEVAEYNPLLDKNNRSLDYMIELLTLVIDKVQRG